MGGATRESLKNKQINQQTDRKKINKTKKAELNALLAHYSPDKPTKDSVDASSYGLGGVLLQKEENDWKPVFTPPDLSHQLNKGMREWKRKPWQ